MMFAMVELSNLPSNIDMILDTNESRVQASNRAHSITMATVEADFVNFCNFGTHAK